MNPEDAFVNAIIGSFPQQATTVGTYTEQDLKNRFEQLYKVGRKTASIDENGGTLGAYFWSYVKSIFLVDLPKQYSEQELIDVNNTDNYEVGFFYSVVVLKKMLRNRLWRFEKSLEI